MYYETVLEYFGTQVAIAKALGIKQPSINKWKNKGVPDGAQWQIEVITKGALKADDAAISRHNRVAATLSRNQVSSLALVEY